MDDLISRAAALDVINTWGRQKSEKVRMGLLHRDLDAIPAVDATPVVHGEWVEEHDRAGHYHCSNCGVVWGIAAKAMKYCPNCAAKMMNSPIWEVEDAK